MITALAIASVCAIAFCIGYWVGRWNVWISNTKLIAERNAKRWANMSEEDKRLVFDKEHDQ